MLITWISTATLEAVQQAFIDFAGKIKTDGFLFTRYGLARNKDLPSRNHLTYSLVDKNADIHLSGIRMVKGSYEFDMVMRGWYLNDVVLNMGGIHNIENTLVSIAVAHRLGIDDEKIKDSVASFKGVRRRFEFIVKK